MHKDDHNVANVRPSRGPLLRQQGTRTIDYRPTPLKTRRCQAFLYAPIKISGKTKSGCAVVQDFCPFKDKTGPRSDCCEISVMSSASSFEYLL